ncbi:MAG: hypothetical protein L6R37_007320 [Teloschistes peruensis]|nr:MAG: hypothetical protein L6R37_007320 [Teloschistes peruensis]
MGDGSVLGDPASVELTKAIIGIGWQPPTARSRWDLLPLVVMADNDVPVMIEIPSDLGRQIHIRHPRHQAAFEKLDLRWVAAPALARLGFDIGGVQYTAAPFIGWFMDAEIGVRDLADTFRYNTLPDVAKALGLLDKHFKDGVESLDDLPEYERQCILTQAQTELTYAVYWSYQQAKVSMSDTLTASMKWCRYDDNFKAKNGYRLPADPYWLAPPQGSIIPVWHRGGAPNYQPKPMISKHVQDPLKAWERERPQSFVAAEQLKDPHRKIHRPNLQCRSSTNDGILPAWTERHVHESIALTGERPVEGTNTIEALTVDEKFSISAIDPTPPRLSVSIYFCSAGTFAEKVALKLHLRLRDLAKIIPSVSVSSKIACLNELQLPPSCTDQIVLVVASSTGQGEVPTNGGRFITLCDGDTEKQLHNPRSSFKFAVFGNGDSRYAATYNGAAITIERKLQRLGGLPLLGSFHQGDTALQSTALQALNPWWAKLQPTLQDLATQSPKLRRTISDDVCNNGPMLMPSDIHTEAKSRFASQSQQLHSDFNSAKVISVNPPPRNDYQGTYLVTLDIGHMRYNDMDCIQILPVNAPAKVRRALRALGVTGSTPMSIDFADTISPTYSSFLTEYIDLESPLQNLDFLEQLDSASTSEEKLQSLSSLTALEHLNKSGLLPTSTETTTSILLSLPLLHPRTYSIASSLSHTTLPTPHPHPPSQNEKTNNHLDILVKPLPHGRFSQLFLSSAPPTLSLRYRLLPSAASRLLTLPPTTPLVVVATGAGFAPVRCLLQRCIALASSSTPQQTRQNEKPNIFLHIGLKPTDLPLFAPTLNDAAATGVLTSLSITPSNDAKMRVQDRLVERGVKEMVKEKGAWVFVCSGVDCARGVREVLGCAEEEGVVEGIGERWVEEVF